MEMMDVVNDKDEVVGQVDKEDVYKKLLCHWIVHVLIFNDEGKLALQLRHPNLSFAPNHWSTTVGGHVQAGESYEDATKREMREEVGVETPIEYFSKDSYHALGQPDKFIVCYRAKYNGPFQMEPEAVVEVEFFTIEEIKSMIEQGEKFHPELLFILKKYFL
ncbi:MAG TPA: NUDIX domain-containing protein [Patescibacteria group bacterium]|nr:NUDIX domain-containing protein [Patescibacteria group bacterium]